MKLALFKRTFCNGSKIKRDLIIKAVTQWRFVLQSSCVDQSSICWSVISEARRLQMWIYTEQDFFFSPCIIICALSVFKVHKCQFFPHSIKKRPKENKVTFVKCWRWKAVEFPVFEMRPTSKFLICWLCLELVSINWVAESKLWPCLLLPDISLVILCVERFGGPVESMTQLQVGEAGC